MRSLKQHLLNYLEEKLQGHKRLLVLGPLDISKKRINKAILEIRPTIIILVDGGVKHKTKIPKSMSKFLLSVGDGDSSLDKMPLDLLLPKQKNYSDLAFVADAIIGSKRSCKKITLLGLSSTQSEKRPDHFLFNLGVIEKLAQKLTIKIEMDDHFIALPAGKNTFKYNGNFSVIALRPTQLKINGKARYLLKDWTRLSALNSLGLSNYANGNVIIENKKVIILYLAGSSSNLCV